MKKSLSFLLAIALVFGLFSAMASAATPTASEAGKQLQDLGVLKGDKDGNLLEDSTWNRQDVVVLLARLLGKEAAAQATAKSHTYKDVPAGYYDSFLSWAKNEKYAEGYSATKFGFGETLTYKQFAAIILRALGQDTTGTNYENTAALAVKAGILPEGTNFDAPAKRGDTFVAIVAALSVEVAGTGKTLGAILGLPGYGQASAISSFAATGAKNLTVKFNGPVKGDVTFAVKRDSSLTVNVAETKWNDAKTEATLVASFALQTGKYTVSVKGGDLDLTASADVTAAKVSKIEFPSDKGIIADSSAVGVDKLGLRTSIKISNQYGEDITASVAESDLDLSASKGAKDTVGGYNKGAIALKDSADYVVDQKVVVTVVHKATGTVATQTLTVVQSANVASIEIGQITTDDSDLKGKPINVSNLNGNPAKYYIPFTAKDQYGNVLSKAELAALTIISSNSSVLNLDTAANLLEIGADKKTALKVLAATGTATNGVVVVTVVSPNGTSANATLEVAANPKIDVLNVDQPAAGLKKNVKVQIPFTAADQFGNALTSDSQLGSTDVTVDSVLNFTDGTKITVTGGLIEAGVDYGNKNARTISITPQLDTVVVTVVTANNKVQNVTWGVQAAPVATAIKGLHSDVYTAIQQGLDSNLKYDQVLLVDQYGDSIGLADDWTVSIAPNDGSFDAVTPDETVLENGTAGADATAAVWSASTTTKGSEAVTFTLKDNTGKTIDEYTTSFESVALADISTFQIADVAKVYTGGDINGRTYDRAITLEGLKGSKKVLVDQTLIKAATITGGLTVAASHDKIVAPTVVGAKVSTDGADKTATLSVIVDAANGAQTLTKAVTYNDAAPVATTVKIVKNSDSSEITGAAFVATTAGLTGKSIIAAGTKAEFYFEVKDQYGIVNNDNLGYAITSKDPSSATVTVSTAGVITVSGTAAGNSFQVTLVSANGITKTLKVILSA